MSAGEVYTVHLVIRAEQLEGEDIRWDHVATALAARAQAPLKLGAAGEKRFRVEAEVDSAEAVEDAKS